MSDKNKFKNQDIDELLKNATESVDDNYSEVVSTQENKTGKVIIVGVTLFAILVGVGVALIPKANEFIDKSAKPSWVIEELEKPQGVVDIYKIKYPVDVPEWTKQPASKFTPHTVKADYESIREWTSSLANVQNELNWLPSSQYSDGLAEGDVETTTEEATGEIFEISVDVSITNDLEKQFVGEGNETYENPNFYYTLREDYEITYAVGVQQLINPIFGAWSSAQHSGDYDIKSSSTFNILKRVMSDKWWESNIKENEDYSRLPILADWNRDDFGGLALITGDDKVGTGHFFGQVINTDESNPTFTEVGTGHFGRPIFETSTPVKFVTFLEGGATKELTGVLKLTLSPNEYEFNSENRVVISESSLILD